MAGDDGKNKGQGGSKHIEKDGFGKRGTFDRGTRTPHRPMGDKTDNVPTTSTGPRDTQHTGKKT